MAVGLLKNYIWSLLALAIVAVWGSTFASTKVVIYGGMSPLGIMFYRFFAAWLFMLLICHHKFLSDNIRDELRFLLLGILGGSLYYFLQNTALLFTQTTNVSFLLSLCPLFTILLSHIFLKDNRIGWKTWFGIIIALIGVFMVITGGNGGVLHCFPKGDIMAVTAAFEWAVYTIILVPVSKKYPVGMISRKVFFYGWITALPLMMDGHLQSDAQAMFSEPVIWLNMAFLTLMASVFCYQVWNILIVKMSPAALAPFLYLDSFFAVIFSYLFLDEKMTFILFSGLLLILSRVIIARTDHRHIHLKFILCKK